MPLFAKDVSKRFLDIVRHHLEIVISAGLESNWSLEFINSRDLENIYVSESLFDREGEDVQSLLKEEYLRSRFRTYMRDLKLLTSNEEKLHLNIEFHNHHIMVTDAP